MIMYVTAMIEQMMKSWAMLSVYFGELSYEHLQEELAIGPVDFVGKWVAMGRATKIVEMKSYLTSEWRIIYYGCLLFHYW